jgi:hypothetical protein
MELRPLRAIKKLEAELEELHRADQAAEEAARFEIVQSASRFSRRSKEVVDSTMSLSATLMRAGEVHEANRLLADAEMEVRNEEAALIETVNEAKVHAARRRHRISRLRIFKAVATVALGSTLTMGSAFGVVLTNHLINRPEQVADAATTRNGNDGRGRAGMKSVPVAGMNLKLTDKQFKKYKQLVAGRVDRAELKRFLRDVLADDPFLVAEIHAALVGTAGVDVAEVIDPLAAELVRAKPAPSEGATSTPEAQEPQPSPEDEPSESPSDPQSPSDDPDDSPQPSPEPNPTPPDDGGDEDGAGDGLPLLPDDEDGG